MDDVALMLPTPAEPPNGEYAVVDRGIAGKQMLARFAVVHAFGEADVALGERGSLCYATPLTNDVIGHQTAEEIVVILHKIARLERNDDCSHGRSDDESEYRDNEPSLGDMLDSLLGSIKSLFGITKEVPR